MNRSACTVTYVTHEQAVHRGCFADQLWNMTMGVVYYKKYEVLNFEAESIACIIQFNLTMESFI